MTKAEISERFKRILEKAMARPLDEFTTTPPANPTPTARLQPLRVAED